jgi:hypothetical protein
MRAWLAAHWTALAGVLLTVPGWWSGFKWLLDWGGRIDVFKTWGSALIEHLPTVPPWAGLVLLALGLIIIWWDLRGRGSPDLAASPVKDIVAPAHIEVPIEVAQKAPIFRPHYAVSEIETMIAALQRMRAVVHQKGYSLYEEASALYQNWQPAMWNHSQLPDAEKIRGVADKLRSFSQRAREIAPELQKIIFENQAYQDVLRPVFREAKGSPGGMTGPLDRLVADLSTILDLIGGTQPQSNGMFRFLTSHYQEWHTELQNLGQWNGSVEARITEKTKELREWRRNS